MSIQSDASKKHIEDLLIGEYGIVLTHSNFMKMYIPDGQTSFVNVEIEPPTAYREYHFNLKGLKKNPKTGRLINDWRFDYAVPALLCAKPLYWLPFLNFPRCHSGAHIRDRRGHISAGQDRSCQWCWSQELA